MKQWGIGLFLLVSFRLMFSQTLYLVRSKLDGQYLVARSRPQPEAIADTPAAPLTYLLLFKEYADALSYLNAHASELADRFAIETLPGSQLGTVLKRWGFTGVGIVQDPLVPRIDFLQQEQSYF